jgi:hypothetical protein
MKTGMLLYDRDNPDWKPSTSKSAIQNRARKNALLAGKGRWNSTELGQVIDAYGEYVPAPVQVKKRSKIMARLRKERDVRLRGRKK